MHTQCTQTEELGSAVLIVPNVLVPQTKDLKGRATPSSSWFLYHQTFDDNRFCSSRDRGWVVEYIGIHHILKKHSYFIGK